MKKLVFLFVSIFVLVVAAQNVKAQPEAAANGTATAKILEPIAISAINDLEFGSIAAGSSVSDVVMTSGGVRSTTGNADLYTSDAGQQGTFDVTGESNHTYTITLPDNGDVTLTSGGNSMDVKDFESTPATGSLDAAGKQTINVGATLVVGASQAAGSYTGSYTVTVNYN